MSDLNIKQSELYYSNTVLNMITTIPVHFQDPHASRINAVHIYKPVLKLLHLSCEARQFSLTKTRALP